MTKLEIYDSKIEDVTNEWFRLHYDKSITLDGNYSLTELEDICNVLKEFKKEKMK